MKGAYSYEIVGWSYLKGVRGLKMKGAYSSNSRKLADAMYDAAQSLTTDASCLRKAMEEYHQFVINEL